MSNLNNIAFIITDNQNNQHVFYAKNEHRAGHAAMLKLKLDERQITIKRGFMFDAYEGKPIPPKLALSNGFNLECIYCEKPISQANTYRIDENDIYCSVNCQVDMAEIIGRFNL
ncbi:MAG: hypothetical protein COB24_09165 [Hyphomicrobiales bacterium]|nr:MAG: hypothetical protein COB24_09165 [Hyphomicrobiales bacterium]